MAKLEKGECAVYLTRATETKEVCPCFKLGRPDASAVATLAPAADSDVYICGPVTFMDDMREAFVAAGVPAANVHSEAFGTGNRELEN